MKYRDKFIAGRLSSVKAPVGTTQWRGISTIASGTTVCTVAAADCVSGAAINVTPYMYANAVSSGGNLRTVLTVGSVQAGQFMVFCAGSVAPTAAMPFAWQVLR